MYITTFTLLLPTQTTINSWIVPSELMPGILSPKTISH